MRQRIASLLSIGAIVTGCTMADTSGKARETPQIAAYNQGVDAYRRKDYGTAATQWRKAIALGNTLALNNLGYLTYYGLGLTANPAEAVELWRKGATRGVSEAQWHLGTAYQEGKGVPRDPVQSFAWTRCAVATAMHNAKTDDTGTELDIADDARKSLVKIADTLPADKLEIARKQADDCIKAYSAQAQP